MYNTFELLKQIKSTSKLSEKEKILKENKEDKLFLEVIRFLLDPYIITGISGKKVKKCIKINDFVKKENENDIMGIIYYLKNNNTGKDIDILKVQNFLDGIKEEYKDIATEIITKKIKLGMTATTANKILDDNDKIPMFEVMLAEKFKDNKKKLKGKTFIVTLKLDGERGVIIIENRNITLKTRSGRVIEGCNDLIDEIIKILPIDIDMVYDGELILKNTNNLPSRELFQETQKMLKKKGEKKDIIFNMFDMIPLEEFKKGKGSLPCIERKNEIHNLLKDKKSELLKEVEMLYVGTDINKVDEILKELEAKRLEGAMVNIADAPYECKRSKNLLKCKTFKDADVRVVDILEGEGENAGALGSIVVEFLVGDEIHTSKVGSGFTQEERRLYFDNPSLLLGKIVTITYFEITKDSKTKEYGLNFSSWTHRIRDDKTEISMY